MTGREGASLYLGLGKGGFFSVLSPLGPFRSFQESILITCVKRAEGLGHFLVSPRHRGRQQYLHGQGRLKKQELLRLSIQCTGCHPPPGTGSCSMTGNEFFAGLKTDCPSHGRSGGQRQDHPVVHLALGRRTLSLSPHRQGRFLRGVAWDTEFHFFPQVKGSLSWQRLTDPRETQGPRILPGGFSLDQKPLASVGPQHS